jgi:hypothetical protein
VIGGTTDDVRLLASTEVFDPATGRFSPGPTMSEPRYKLTGGAATLSDGRVMVAGGGRTVEVLDVARRSSAVLERSPLLIERASPRSRRSAAATC